MYFRKKYYFLVQVPVGKINEADVNLLHNVGDNKYNAVQKKNIFF